MMTELEGLELPIKKVHIRGPAVRALADRKEANDHHRITTAELRETYSRVKPSLMTGLALIGSSKGV